MGLARGKYGVEYVVHPEKKVSHAFGWTMAAVLAVAMVSFCATVAYPRIRDSLAAPPPPASGEEPADSEPETPPAAESALAGIDPVDPGDMKRRGSKTKALLMRLAEAKKKRDLEMAVSTLEQLRAQPAKDIADLDGRFARELGNLNIELLFGRKSERWVATVELKRGDTASRLAYERGSTFASLKKLNPEIRQFDNLAVGMKIRVMDHPHFTLVVHKAGGFADLSLNGKFFKRYATAGEVGSGEGNFEAPAKLRTLFAEKGISFSADDLSELETLIPMRTPVLVSDL